jgi:hypothetical protein
LSSSASRSRSLRWPGRRGPDPPLPRSSRVRPVRRPSSREQLSRRPRGGAGRPRGPG